ncbi:DUF4440 domain-containing protein [candidate division KSB1 bacterium]|nr:DUF4440 domain-containing protein [candidate division KSB1 bacterium]
MRFNQFIKLTLFLVITLLAFLNCQPDQEDSAKIREAIVAANGIFMEAFNKGDAVGLAACYTAEGQLLPGNSDFITGTQAIQNFWQGVMNMGIKSARLETIEVEGMGKTAYEIGKYQLFADGNQMADQGKYIVIWKQVEGKWKLHRDIWNTSLPAQKAEAEK